MYCRHVFANLGDFYFLYTYMNNNILFIGATHGNERVGVDALALLQQEKRNFDWIIGNPCAFAQNVRFTEKDMNRCGLGNPDSNTYEERRAAEIQAIAKEYTYTIDIHGVNQATETFLLITNPKKENLRLASFFDIDKVIIWPSLTSEMQYPLSEFFSCGIEIEVGSQQDPKNTENLYKSLLDFVSMKEQNEMLMEEEWKQKLISKRLYEMTGPILKSDTLTKEMLEDGREITDNNETYIPWFVGTYPYTNILGYKFKPLNSQEFRQKFL